MSTKLYRRKPLLVEVMFYDGLNGAEVAAWCRGIHENPGPLEFVEIYVGGDTLMAIPGDYIVHGPNDEFWPVPEARFLATYDPIIRNHH